MGAPAKALHQQDPDAFVGALCISSYTAVLRTLRYVDQVIDLAYPKNRQERMTLRVLRDVPYLAPFLDGWDELVDLFCPAFAIEARAIQTEFDRMELYCMEAGVHDFSDLTPEWVVEDRYRSQALKLLRQRFPNHDQPLAVIAPRGMDSVRTLKEPLLVPLVKALRRRGFCLSYLDAQPFALLDQLKVPRITSQDWLLLGAFIQMADVMISCDTGAYHVAGAVGSPAVVLAGNQNPDILTRHYPTHVGVASLEYLEGHNEEVPWCSPPCTYNRRLGWDPQRCREKRGGCFFLDCIRVSRVLDAIDQVFFQKCVRRWQDEPSLRQHHESRTSGTAKIVRRVVDTQRQHVADAN